VSDRRRRSASSHHPAGSAKQGAGRASAAARAARAARASSSPAVGGTPARGRPRPERNDAGQSSAPALVDQLRKPFLVSFVVFVITALGLVLVARAMPGG
jgi:hypothetical protein